MSAFKAAFGITSGIGLGVVVIVLAWKVGLAMYKRQNDVTDAETRCQRASTALASGDRAHAVRTFLGGRVDEDVLFELAEQLAKASDPK